MRTARQYHLTVTAFRALPEVDQLLALALTAYEDRIDPSTGQDVTLATHPALAEFWTTMDPVRDYAHTALARAQEAVKDSDHPQAIRHVVGLREGWEDALAAWGKGSAPDEQGDGTEGDQ